MIGILLVALSVPSINQRVLVDRFDLLEVNHVVNPSGGPIFDQVIAWDWHQLDCCFHVAAWKIMPLSRDLSDEDDRKRWIAESDRYVAKWPWQEQPRIRSELAYRGAFVGGPWMPIQTADGWLIQVADSGLDRKIIAGCFRESWTRRDPERIDQQSFPESSRRGWSKPVELVGDE